jgi:hypothetical protein
MLAIAPCWMSALGQKRTFALQKVMSALPLKADMCGAARDVRFGPKADICSAKGHVRFTQRTSIGMDHFVQLRWWNSNAARFHGQDEFKLVCLFDSSHLCHSGL